MARTRASKRAIAEWTRRWLPIGLGYTAISASVALAATDSGGDVMVRWVAGFCAIATLSVFADGDSLIAVGGEMVERGIVVVSLAIVSLNISFEMSTGRQQPNGPWLLLASGAGLALLALVLRRHDSTGRAAAAVEDRVLARLTEAMTEQQPTVIGNSLSTLPQRRRVMSILALTGLLGTAYWAGRRRGSQRGLRGIRD